MTERRHQLTVPKLRQLLKTHQLALQSLYSAAYLQSRERLEKQLTIAIDEAIGRMGLDELASERNALLQQLQQLDQKIARELGGQQVHLDPDRMAKDALGSYQPKGPLYYLPAPMRAEVEAIFVERGWIDNLQLVSSYPNSEITLAYLRENTKTLQEVQDILGKEQRKALDQLQKAMDGKD